MCGTTTNAGIRASHQGPYPLSEKLIRDEMSDMLSSLRQRRNDSRVTREDILVDVQDQAPCGTLLFLLLNVTVPISPPDEVPGKDKRRHLLENILSSGVKTNTAGQFMEIVNNLATRDCLLHWGSVRQPSRGTVSGTALRTRGRLQSARAALVEAARAAQVEADTQRLQKWCDGGKREDCDLEGEFPVLLLATGDDCCKDTRHRMLGVLFIKRIRTLRNAWRDFKDDWGPWYFYSKEAVQNQDVWMDPKSS